METITKPLCKIGKVTHLLKIAKELNILHDKMFDQLMDKYEQNYLMFDFMLENINSCILEKVSVDITKDNFLLLLTLENHADVFEATYFNKLYTPKKLDYE